MTQDEFKEECARIRLDHTDVAYLLSLGGNERQIDAAAAAIVKKLYDKVAPLLDTDDGKPTLYVERDMLRNKWMRQVYLSRDEYTAYTKTATHNLSNYQLVGLHLRPARIRQK